MASGVQGRFSLLGIPVRIDPSLVLVLVIISTSAHISGSVLIAFIVGGALSVVAHELGHALAARRAGATGITISLLGFGGLTHYRLATPSRLRRTLITAAGPAVGLGLGSALWLLRAAANPSPFSTEAQVFHQLLFVTVGWSLLNLLPVLPLDGGRLLEQLLVGSAQNRHRIAGIVSTVVAGWAAADFWHQSQRYPAVVFALLCVYGVAVAVQGAAPGSPHRHTPSCAVFRLAVAGDYPNAAMIARDGRTIDPPLRALVEAVANDDREAQAQLWQLYEAKPDDIMVRSCVVMLRAQHQDWSGILAMLRAGPMKLGACTAAMRGAYEAGAFIDGAGIGEAVLRIFPKPVIAYNTACCWARGDNHELALRALMNSVAYGWSDLQRLDADTDFTSLRATEPYRVWRASLSERQSTVGAAPVSLSSG